MQSDRKAVVIALDGGRRGVERHAGGGTQVWAQLPRHASQAA
jgi:hypothetical protein